MRMDLQQRTKRFGIYIILLACILRFAAAGGVGAAVQWLSEKRIIPDLIYEETGRDVRFSSSSGENADHTRESPGLWLPKQEKPAFGEEDAAWVEMDYDCIRRPDLGKLMAQPLDWDLTAGEPTVLILHSHTTESYTRTGETYVETALYRTLEEAHNMLSIGDVVAQVLEEAGIGVIHDRQIHDYPSYNGSYVHARCGTEEILEQYPSIRLILDLHRDASETTGVQLRTEALVAGRKMAQLMLVVGTDVSRQSHEHWQENLSLALKLQFLLQLQAPGIMRPLNLRAQRFNQDLSPGALLVEVGAAGNTWEEAALAARELAIGVAKLAAGTDCRENPQMAHIGNVSK